MHAMNVGIVSAADGPLLRLLGGGDPGPRRRRDAARRRQAQRLPLRLRHREDNFSPSELRVYEEQHRGCGPGPGQADGPPAGGDGGDRPAPRACRTAAAFRSASTADRMTMTRANQSPSSTTLRQPLQPAPAGPGADAATRRCRCLFAQGRSKFDTSILGAFIKMMRQSIRRARRCSSRTTATRPSLPSTRPRPSS